VAAACLVLALGAGAAAFVGVTARTGASTATTVTVRGESVEWLTSGPYAYNAVRTVAEGVGWDWVTLVLAVPALALTAPFVARGSLRARLVASGLAAYLTYQYLQYSTVWALGPLFPAFVALFALGLWTLAALVTGLAGELLARPWPPAFPRKGLVTLALALALVLVLMWSARIAGALGGSVQGVLLGQTTLVVQALDLGLVVPLCLLTAVLAWRRHPWALVWGPVLLGKAVFMGLAIAAMLLVAWSVEGRLELVPLGIFAGAAGAAGVLGWRSLRALG